MEGLAKRRLAARLRSWSWRDLWSDASSPILQPLLAASAAMVLLHVLEARGLIDSSPSTVSFDLEVDRSLGELLGYLILASIIAGLYALARREHNDRLLFTTAAVFTFALLDDLLTFHERAGHWFARELWGDPILGLRPEEVGQLLYFLVAGSVIVGLWFGVRRGASAPAAAAVAWIGGALVVFAGFAVGVDFLHELIRTQTTAIEPLLVAIEDGGELVVLSMISSYVFARLRDDEPITLDDELLIVIGDLEIDLRTPEPVEEAWPSPLPNP